MNFIFVTENKKLRRKIATLQRTCHRQQEKIIILQKFKRKAVSKKFEKETAIKALEKSFSSPQARILVHEKKQARKWSKDDIAEGLLLRSFSRRAYNFLREKKKLQHIFSELKSFYGKNIPIDTAADEDNYSIDRLWDKLDVSIQNRENLLDKALEKFEKMNCTYERISRENKALNENITHHQDQLNNVRVFLKLVFVRLKNSFFF